MNLQPVYVSKAPQSTDHGLKGQCSQCGTIHTLSGMFADLDKYDTYYCKKCKEARTNEITG